MKSFSTLLALVTSFVPLSLALAGGISGGTGSTCVIDSRYSALYCVGSGQSGDLATGSTVSSSYPMLTELAAGVTDVTSGYLFGCAILQSKVYCWGDNSYGQLGRGSYSFGTYSSIPMAISLPADAVEVSSGSAHSCALLTNGDIYCWGQGSEYQLGTGQSNLVQPTPTRVVGPAGLSAVAVSAGGFHTCALYGNASAATVYCWGRNNYGQTGATATPLSQPVQVPTPIPGFTATQISGGGQFTCAISGGGAYCWGINTYGELGDGTTTSRSTPHVVSGLTAGVRTVRASEGDHACASQVKLGVQCWGDNRSGQLGNGTTTTSLVPVTALGGSLRAPYVSDLGVGSQHSCARMDSPVVAGGPYLCWGMGSSGELGNGATPTAQTTPVTMQGVR